MIVRSMVLNMALLAVLLGTASQAMGAELDSLNTCVAAVQKKPTVQRAVQSVGKPPAQMKVSEWIAAGANEALACGSRFGPQLNCALDHITRDKPPTPDDTACVESEFNDLSSKQASQKSRLVSALAEKGQFSPFVDINTEKFSQRCADEDRSYEPPDEAEFMVAICSYQLLKSHAGLLAYSEHLMRAK